MASDEIINWIPNLSEDREIFIEFLKEAKFRMEDIESRIMELEDNNEDTEIIDDLFRQFHSIKGSASLLNIEPVSRLGHEVESVLDDIREGKRKVSIDCTDYLFSSLDTLKILVHKIEEEMNRSE